MFDKIKWLFMKWQFGYQINKLSLSNGDIVVIKPPKNNKWNSEKAQRMHTFIKEFLESNGYKNLNITFVEDINIGVISKNNE
jgi:phage pi2 protein 07